MIMKIVVVTAADSAATAAVVVDIPEVVVALGDAMGSSATMLKSHPQADSECCVDNNDSRLVALLSMMIIAMMV